MTSRPIDQPYRGSGIDRPRGVPLPPGRMPLLRAGQLRKRWHYVSFWSRELSFCAARASVGPLQQEYWGIWDREGNKFREGSHRFTRHVRLEPNRVQVWDGDAEIAVTFEPCTSFEVYRPAGGAYIWSHKDYCRQARGSVRYNGTKRSVRGVIFVDINAGYHERHTQWRWAAGAGLDQHNRLVAFNAITGLFDTPTQSERTVWIEGDAQEVGRRTVLQTTCRLCTSPKAAPCALNPKRSSNNMRTCSSYAPTTSTGSAPTRAPCPAALSCVKPTASGSVMTLSGSNSIQCQSRDPGWEIMFEV